MDLQTIGRETHAGAEAPAGERGTSLRQSVRFARRLLAGIALLFTAGLAAAQTPEPPLPWRLTISGVWYSGTTSYRLEGAVSGDVHFDSAAGFGLRLTHEVLSWFDVGVGWSHVVTDLKLSGSEPDVFGSRQLNTIEAGGDFHWTRGPIRLSFLTGIGGAGTGHRGGTNLTASVGGGLSFAIDRRFALRLEERWRATYGNLGPGDRYAFCDESGCYAYRSRLYENSESLGGLTLSF